MLYRKILSCCHRLRLLQYRSLFTRIRDKSWKLSPAEVCAADVVYVLGRPTVKQFSEFLGISLPDASYRVRNLIAKGLVDKIPSKEDRRAYYLQATDKLHRHFHSSQNPVLAAINRLEQKYAPEQLQLFCEILEDLTNEEKGVDHGHF